jgi:hypothetical protein
MRKQKRQLILPYFLFSSCFHFTLQKKAEGVDKTKQAICMIPCNLGSVIQTINAELFLNQDLTITDYK